MLTNKDYCDYETCVALKELGYKEPTSAYYMPHHKDLIWVSNPFRGGYVTDCFYSHNSLPKDVMTANFIDAPTLWEAQKWLREEKEMVLRPSYLRGANAWICEICYERERLGFGGYNQSYEEALAEGVREAVKILKEK
jgi:hypothetical protein